MKKTEKVGLAAGESEPASEPEPPESEPELEFDPEPEPSVHRVQESASGNKNRYPGDTGTARHRFAAGVVQWAG